MSDKHNYIEIQDHAIGIPAGLLSIPMHYRNDLDEILIPNGLILDRTDKLASEIFKDLAGNGPVICLCILKGGFRFFADLTSRLQKFNETNDLSLPMMFEYIRLKSYNNTESKGEVEITGFPNISHIQGKNILIVEDMIDTGKTMEKLLSALKVYSPKNVRVCSLLIKRTSNGSGYIPDYVGFSIPGDRFIVGYATDLNEHFRDLEHIAYIKEASIVKYKQ